MINLFAVMIGGAAGAGCRYLLTVSLSRFSTQVYSLGTFSANILGSFAIGIALAMLILRPDAPDWMKFGIVSGFLGGFTTLSAVSLETYQLAEAQSWGAAIAYPMATVVCGLAACALGVVIGRTLIH